MAAKNTGRGKECVRIESGDGGEGSSGKSTPRGSSTPQPSQGASDAAAPSTKSRMGPKKKFLVDYLEDVGGGISEDGNSARESTVSTPSDTVKTISSSEMEPLRRVSQPGVEGKLDMANCIELLVHTEVNKPAAVGDSAAAATAAEEERRANSFFTDRRNNNNRYQQQQLQQQAVETPDKPQKRLSGDFDLSLAPQRPTPASDARSYYAPPSAIGQPDNYVNQSHERIRSTPDGRAAEIRESSRNVYETTYQSPRLASSSSSYLPQEVGQHQGYPTGVTQRSPLSREGVQAYPPRAGDYPPHGTRYPNEQVYVVEEKDAAGNIRHRVQSQPPQQHSGGYPSASWSSTANRSTTSQQLGNQQVGHPSGVQSRSSYDHISPHYMSAEAAAVLAGQQRAAAASRDFPSRDYPKEISGSRDFPAREYPKEISGGSREYPGREYPKEIPGGLSAGGERSGGYRTTTTPSQQQGYYRGAPHEQYDPAVHRRSIGEAVESERRGSTVREDFEIHGSSVVTPGHDMGQRQQVYDRNMDRYTARRLDQLPGKGGVAGTIYPRERQVEAMAPIANHSHKVPGGHGNDAYDGRGPIAAMLSAPNLPSPLQKQQKLSQQYYAQRDMGQDSLDQASSKRALQESSMHHMQRTPASYISSRGSIITGSSNTQTTSPPRSYIAEPPSPIELVPVEPSVQPRPSGLHQLANIAAIRWPLPSPRSGTSSGGGTPGSTRYYENEPQDGKSHAAYPFSAPGETPPMRTREGYEVSSRMVESKYRSPEEASAAALDLTIKPRMEVPRGYPPRFSPQQGDPRYEWVRGSGGPMIGGELRQGKASPRVPGQQVSPRGQPDVEQFVDERRNSGAYPPGKSTEYDERQRATWMSMQAQQQRVSRAQHPTEWTAAAAGAPDERERMRQPGEQREQQQHRARLMAALARENQAEPPRSYQPRYDSRTDPRMDAPSRGRLSEEEMVPPAIEVAPSPVRVRIVDVPIDSRPVQTYHQVDSTSLHTSSSAGSHLGSQGTPSPNIPQLSPIQPLKESLGGSGLAPGGLTSQIPPISAVDAAAAARKSSMMSLLGSYAPNDILEVECKCCWSKYGSLRSFRIHFAKVHGLEPSPDNFIVHTISQAKLAKAGGSDGAISKVISAEREKGLSEGRSSAEYYSLGGLSKGDIPPTLAREKLEECTHTQQFEGPLRQGGRGDTAPSGRPLSVSGAVKQVAEVYPMLASRVETEVRGKVREEGELGEGRVKEEGGKRSPQCVRCRVRDKGEGLEAGGSRAGLGDGSKQRLDEGSTDAHCSTCMEGFRDISDWRVHVSSMHMMRSCACKTCNIGFTHAGALHKHLSTVHGVEDCSGITMGRVEVEYRCLFCPQSFNDEEVLYRHTAEHEKEYAARRLGVGRGVSSYIECAVPDTTCPEDQKPSTSCNGWEGRSGGGPHSDNSPPSRSPGSNHDDNEYRDSRALRQSDELLARRFIQSEPRTESRGGRLGDDCHSDGHYGNSSYRDDRASLKLHERVNDVIEHVLTSSSSGHGDIIQDGEEAYRMREGDDQRRVNPRSDSVRKFIENLVVREMKKPVAPGQSSGIQAPVVRSQASISGAKPTQELAMGRHRSSTISFPASGGEFSRLGDNSSTLQLLQAARSARLPQLGSGRREGSISEREAAQSNALALLRLSTGQMRSDTRSPGEISSRRRETANKPLFLRDLVSLMNQEVENSIRGYSSGERISRGEGRKSPTPVGGSSPASAGSTPRQRCVRDVCDEIIAQSFRDETSSASSSPTARRSSPGISALGMAALYGRPYSASTGSPSRSDEEFGGKHENKESSESTSGLPAGRAALTLKELMENPEMVKNYKQLAGLNGGSPAGSQERPVRTGTAPVRRRSEESCSLSQFFGGGSANTFERRRNQTFSVARSGTGKSPSGNSLAPSGSASGTSSSMEILEARKRVQGMDREGQKGNQEAVTSKRIKLEQEDKPLESDLTSCADFKGGSALKDQESIKSTSNRDDEIKQELEQDKIKSCDGNEANDTSTKPSGSFSEQNIQQKMELSENFATSSAINSSDDDDDDDDDDTRYSGRKRKLVIDETVDEPASKLVKNEDKDDIEDSGKRLTDDNTLSEGLVGKEQSPVGEK